MRKTMAAMTEQDLPVGEVVLVPTNKGLQEGMPPKLPCVVIEKLHDKY
jgi:hypothetical protein